MKTAMQELIDSLNKELLIKNKNPQLNEWYRMAIKSYILIASNLLEKENKQIMDSWKEGTKYVMDINDGKVIPPMSAIDYLIYFKTEKSDYYTIFTDNKYL